MNEGFLNIIEQYKVNKDLIDKIRIYILNHLYMTDDITQYVTLFSDTAKLIGDDVGYALSRGMLFWVYHGRDIELAHKYNQESLALYHKINDYSNKIGYLSILNNEFIYNNYTGTLHESYKIMCEAMQIAEENKNINYYFVYSINGIYLLLDLGLYDKALEAKEKLLDEINQTLVVVTKQDKKIYDEFSDFRYKFLFQKMQQLTAFIKDINNLEDSNALEKLIKDNLSQILGASFVELEIADENFKYKGLNLKQIDDLKIFNLNELKEDLKDSCDSLACIKINEINLNCYLYILIGLKAMDALEQKEILYMLSLVKEVLSPVLLQFERYNEAMSNYRHDQLTHVYNRYGLDYIIKEQFNHANMLYLLMIDIDNFKHINDTYGHEAGDDILIKVAGALNNCLGNKNVARIGGEEFIGLIPSNNKDIKDKLDDIMNNVRSIKIQNEIISISVGVSKMLSPNDFKEAKLEADRKLYVAKNSGKNKYIL